MEREEGGVAGCWLQPGTEMEVERHGLYESVMRSFLQMLEHADTNDYAELTEGVVQQSERAAADITDPVDMSLLDGCASAEKKDTRTSPLSVTSLSCYGAKFSTPRIQHVSYVLA